MSFIKQEENRIKSQFENARVNGSNPRAPRNGYFFIKDVNYIDLPGKGSCPVALVHWKENEQDLFIKDVMFEVILSSLTIGDPLDYMNLVNKTVRIYDTQLVESRINCKHEIVLQKQQFTTLHALLFGTLTGSTKLSEAHFNWEKELGIDLSDAIESEATNCNFYDDFDDDAYDAL